MRRTGQRNVPISPTAALIEQMARENPGWG
jgi:hypothetical protein